MIAPPRVFYMDLNPKGIKGDVTDLVLKSDYDELQAKLDKIYTTEPVAFMTIDKAPYLYRDANPISSDYPIEKLIIKPTKEPA